MLYSAHTQLSKYLRRRVQFFMAKLYQFPEKEISKNFLVTEGYRSLYCEDRFEMDNKVVLLYNLAESQAAEAKSSILHLDHGMILDPRPTKQLMNELCKDNGFGFAISKFLSDLTGIKSYIPFIHLYQAYMPIKGGCRQNTDWISPNLLKNYFLKDGILYLEDLNGYRFQVDFPKGDIEKRFHDVALLVQANFLFLKAILNWGHCQMQPPAELGVLKRFENCQCLKHQNMRIKVNDLDAMILAFKKCLLINLGIDELERFELTKYYGQNLKRLKKLY